jgi:hypothetical protein
MNPVSLNARFGVAEETYDVIRVAVVIISQCICVCVHNAIKIADPRWLGKLSLLDPGAERAKSNLRYCTVGPGSGICVTIMRGSYGEIT